jgi:hypothetical protein
MVALFSSLYGRALEIHILANLTDQFDKKEIRSKRHYSDSFVFDTVTPRNE